MKFLSICSGIDAASVAFNPLGWEAVGFSEIEPFPCAVLTHRYPSVPNFGDMTKFAEWPEDVLVQADAVVGGPPCQAFSVAGLRGGLNDARGNLTLTYVDLINHVDAARSVRGLPPAVVLYENVPGLLSDKTNAFGCFLGGLAGEDGALEPPGGKWSYAGVVFGPTRTVAWRTLDAQYFGIPQRRRRVFVVASARADIDPTEILLERDGVRRDTAPRREAGQGVAPCVTAGAGNGGAAHGARSGSAKDNLIVPVGGRPDVAQPYAVANCLTQRMHKGINSTLDEGQTPVLVFDTTRVTSPANHSNPQPGDPYHPLAAGAHVPAIAFPANLSGTQCASSEDIAPAMGAKNPTGVAYALQDVRDVQKAQNGRGWNDEGVSYTVDTHATQGVAYTTKLHNTASNQSGKFYEEYATSLDRSSPPPAVIAPVVAAFKGGQGSSAGGIGYSEHVSPTLNSADSGSNRTPTLLTAMQVRRLTPVECERLQGFPDGYTDIPWGKKPAGQCPDGPRYKALGNSWAVPVVRWIGQRISHACTHNLDTPHA